MKIIAISDTHGHLPQLPKCDLVIHAGDICPVYNHKVEFQRYWLQEDWLKWKFNIPARKSVFIPGNHDFIFEKQVLRPYVTEHFLIDRAIEYEGLKIWGYPWQPWFLDWAFNAPKSEFFASIAEEEVFLTQKLNQIPQDIDILISHGPPYLHGDLTPDGRHVGSKALLKWILEHQPKLVICGHIHNGYGDYTIGNTQVYNVAYLGEDYKTINPIKEIEI